MNLTAPVYGPRQSSDNDINIAQLQLQSIIGDYLPIGIHSKTLGKPKRRLNRFKKRTY